MIEYIGIPAIIFLAFIAWCLIKGGNSGNQKGPGDSNKSNNNTGSDNNNAQ